MKLHGTLVDHLLKLMEINSGWKDEWKLKAALKKLDVSVYTQQNGSKILVASQDIGANYNEANQKEDESRNQRLEALIADAKKYNGE